mgnify:CR=1 FL=1
MQSLIPTSWCRPFGRQAAHRRRVLGLVLQGTVRPCYDYRIMEEYRDVLNRPKFKFPSWMVNDLLEQIEAVG